MISSSFYHAHVYFTRETRDSAEAFRAKIEDTFSGRVRVHGLIDVPIGPHPLPMFEVDIPGPFLHDILPWLEKNHREHPILVHPLTGNDLADHKDHPHWIGPALPLKLDVL